jgi:endonuclease/exonuclease/phosphatase family metal-dependent hydrolase
MPLIAALSYNIHECVGIDGRRDPCRIGEIIKESRAGIVGLQEVHSESDGGVESHQMSYLASSAGLQAAPSRLLRRKNGEYGNVLLTRHKILNIEQLDLTVPGREPRSAIDADLDIGGEPVRVVVTHLGLRPAERRWQVARLLKALAVERTRATIVLCDLNEWWPRSRPLQWIEDRFGKTKRLATFPAPFPILSLDRIFVSPPAALISVDLYKNPLTRRASDHLPLIAEIRIPEARVLG